MGCQVSKQIFLDPKTATDLALRTGFSEEQLQGLYQRFLALGAESQGLYDDRQPYLASTDLLNLPQLDGNLLARRIILSMYKERLPENFYDLDVQVDESTKSSLPFDQIQIPFESFAKAFARYRKPHHRPEHNNEFNSVEGKLKFIFGMFDVNEDRTVSAEEVSEVLVDLNPELSMEQARKFTAIFKDDWGGGWSEQDDDLVQGVCRRPRPGQGAPGHVVQILSLTHSLTVQTLSLIHI